MKLTVRITEISGETYTVDYTAPDWANTLVVAKSNFEAFCVTEFGYVPEYEVLQSFTKGAWN